MFKRINLLLYGLATLIALSSSPATAEERGASKNRGWDSSNYNTWHARMGVQMSFKDGGRKSSPEIDSIEDRFRVTDQFGEVYQFGSGLRLGGTIHLGAIQNEIYERARANNWRWENKSTTPGATIGAGINGIVGGDFRVLTLDLGGGIRKGYKGATPYATAEVMSDFGWGGLKNNRLKIGPGIEFSRDHGRLYYFTLDITE